MNKKVIIGAVASTTAAVGIPVGIMVGKKWENNKEDSTSNIAETAAKNLGDTSTSLVNTFASSFSNGKTSQQALGIRIPEQQGVKYSFTINSTSDGEVTVEVTLSNNGATFKRIIHVEGFKLENKIDQDIVDSIKDSLVDQTTTKGTVESSEIPVGMVTMEQLGITLTPPQGVTFTYEVLNDQQNGKIPSDGFLWVDVTIKKGAIEVVKQIKVTGFITSIGKKYPAENNLVTAAVVKLMQDITNYPDEITKTTHATEVASSIKKGFTHQTSLGITISEQSGIVYGYNVLGTADGEVTVEVTLTKGQVTKSKIIRITGFKTQAQVDQGIINDEIMHITNQTTTKGAIESSMIHTGSVTATDLGIILTPKTSIGVKFTYVVTDNTKDGFVNVRVTATKGSATATKDIVVNGFLTVLKKSKQEIIDGISVLSNITTSLTDTLASSFVNGATIEKALGINFPKQPDVIYEYNVIGTSDGEVEVEVTLTSGSIHQSKTIKVTGFKTQARENKDIVDFAIDSLVDQTTNKNNIDASIVKLGSTTIVDLGISLKPPTGVRFTYEALDNTGDGFLEVRVTAIKGLAKAAKTIKVIGFSSIKASTTTKVNRAINTFSDTTTTKTKASASSFSNGETTQQLLGISIPEQLDIAYNYRVIGTSDGEVDVQITLTSGSIQQTKKIKITGFKTQASFDQDIVDSAIKSLTDQQTAKIDVEASTVPQGTEMDVDLGILINHQLGVRFTYEVIDNSGDGFLKVKVTALKGKATAIKTIRVKGFLTALGKGNILVPKAVNSLSDTTTTLGSVSPSTFKIGPTTQKALGITIPKQSGVSYNYKVVGTSDGEVSVEVTLTSGPVAQTKTIKVTGFKTQAQKDQEIVDVATSSLSDQITTITPAPGAIEIPLGIVKEAAIGISLTPPTGVTYTYEVTDNTGDGVLEVKVTATKKAAIATKIIRVSGFISTKVNADIIVPKAVNVLSNVHTILGTIPSSTFSNGPTTQKELGISIPEQAGVNYGYNILGTNDGEVTILITLSSGPVTKTKIIKVTGFRTQFQSDQDIVALVIKTLTNKVTTKTTEQSIKVGPTTPQELGIDLIDPRILAGATATYKVKTKNEGSDIVTATITKGSITQTFDFNVTGFRTQNQVNQDVVDTAINSFTDQTTTKNTISASSISQGTTTAKELGITIIPPTGVKFSYDVIDNTDDGFLEVELTISQGSASKTKVIKISGFLTISDNAKIIIPKAIDALSNTKTTLTNTLSSALSKGIVSQQVLGTKIIEQPDITYEYKITGISDAEVTVQVTLTSGSIHQSKTIKVIGFKTQAQADQDTVTTIVKTLTDKVTTKTTEQSIKVGPTTPQELGISPIASLILDGATVTYKVKTKNEGSDIVTATITKGKITRTIDFKVINFKAQDQADKEAVRLAIIGLTDQPTTKATVETSVFSNGAKTTQQALGIALTPPNGVTFDFEVVKTHQEGFLEIKVTASKGKETDDRVIKVTGFIAHLSIATKNVDSAISALPDTINTLSKDVLASKFYIGSTTQQALNIVISEEPTPTYEYNIIKIGIGEVTIEVTVTSGLVSKSKTIKVTGFKNTQSQIMYVYNKIEYRTRTEAEAAAKADEDGKIQNKTIFRFNKIIFTSKTDAEAAQIKSMLAYPQTWTSGVAPADGTQAPSVVVDHTVYEYNGKVYETENQANTAWVKDHSHQETLGSATIQYDGHDLPALSVDQLTSSTYSSDADVKKEYGGKLSWVKTTTTGSPAKAMSAIATKFTADQVNDQLQKDLFGLSISGDYWIDGKVRSKIISPKTGQMGTIRDYISATKLPIYEFSENGQDYVAVTHFDKAVDMIVAQDDQNELHATDPTKNILDFFGKIIKNEYTTFNHLRWSTTHIWAGGTPVTPPPGIQLILETLKHLKAVGNVDIYEGEFKNYFNNIPSANPDQPYYDMFSRIIPRSFYDRTVGGTGGSEISDTASTKNFKFFKMSTKNLDAIIAFLESNKTKNILAAPYGYAPGEYGQADKVYAKNSGTQSWSDKIFFTTPQEPIHNSLSLIALSDKNDIFKPNEDYFAYDFDANFNAIPGSTGGLKEVDDWSGNGNKMASGFDVTYFLNSDGTQDKKWGNSYRDHAHPQGVHKYLPIFFDSDKTVVIKKANFLASKYDPYEKIFYNGSVKTHLESEHLLDRPTIYNIPKGTYYKDAKSINTYTTAPQSTSVGYNKPSNVVESRVDHYELQYNGNAISGVTQDIPWTTPTAPAVPTIDQAKVVVPTFTKFTPLVLETLANAKTSGDIKQVNISDGFSDVHLANNNGIDVSKVTKTTGAGFKGFISNGKFYSTEAAAKAAYTAAHSSEVTQEDLKLTYKGKDYQTEADAIKAADAFAVTLVTTKSKDVPITSSGTSTTPNYLPVRSSRNRIKSIEDMYN